MIFFKNWCFSKKALKKGHLWNSPLKPLTRLKKKAILKTKYFFDISRRCVCVWESKIPFIFIIKVCQISRDYNAKCFWIWWQIFQHIFWLFPRCKNVVACVRMRHTKTAAQTRLSILIGFASLDALKTHCNFSGRWESNLTFRKVTLNSFCRTWHDLFGRLGFLTNYLFGRWQKPDKFGSSLSYFSVFLERIFCHQIYGIRLIWLWLFLDTNLSFLSSNFST